MSKSLNFVVNTRLDKRSSDLNGNHPIKLRVWNRASKQAKLYSCNKFTDEDSFNRAMDHKSTVKGDAFKLRLFLERVIANCNEVLEQNQVNTFSDFEKYMFNRTQDASDINFYINRKVEECHKNQQYSSKDIYKGLNKLLEAFSGGKSVQIDNLNKKWFEALESWYLNRKKKNGENYKVSSYSIYIRHFRVIINELVEEGIIELKNYPFGKKKYTIPSAENNKRPLESSDINKLITYQTDCPLKQLAVDYWKLSYFWMGINLKDVITLKWSDVHDDKIFYYRRKTYKKSKVKRKNTIFIDQKTSEIIEKYKGSGKYIFNVLDDNVDELGIYKGGKNFIRKVNQHLKNVAKELEMSTDISSIWSRHSFATQMKRNNVSPYIIQEAFGHRDIKTTENYMSSLIEDDLRGIQEKL